LIDADVLVLPRTFIWQVLFRTFQCMEIDGTKYLKTDLRIDCDSPSHKAASAWATFMILIFPVGVPMLYFSMLHTKRKILYTDPTKAKHLAFFYREYEPACYYWEAVECMRKCFVMGFASFYKPGSLMQLILVIIFTAGYIMLVTNFKPYQSKEDDIMVSDL
jgi:hypothetical protein